MKKSLLLLPISLVVMSLVSCGKSDQPAKPATPVTPPTEITAVDTPPPDYPVKLACAGIGGKSVLNVVVGVEGKPTDVQVQQSSGQQALDDAAVTRVKEWKFNPATRNGQPISQKIQVPVDFKPPQPRPERCFSLDESKAG